MVLPAPYKQADIPAKIQKQARKMCCRAVGKEGGWRSSGLRIQSAAVKTILGMIDGHDNR